MLVKIKDETLTGKVLTEQILQFDAERVSVKTIISRRVALEVQNYNKELPEYFNGLVKPTEAEQTLKGYKVKDKKKIDVERQIYVALNAFQKNAFFVLIDAIQAESLEQEINLRPDTKISFVKLTPLVGG